MLIPEKEPIINFYPVFENNENFDAWELIDLLFTHFTLDEYRHYLHELYSASLYDDSKNSNARDRSNLFFFHSCLNDLATAAYVIAKEKFEAMKKEETKTKADA